MKQKATISLDELDKKCLDELPVILNVLSSTANKLTRIYNPLFDDLVDTLKNKMPYGWQLNKDIFRGIFYPLTDDYRKDSIDMLYAFFSIHYEVSLIPVSSLGNDEVRLIMGLYYDDDDEELKRPCHFFEITRQVRKKASAFHPRSYYQEAQAKIRHEHVETRVYHPETGDNQEDITIIVYEHSKELIEEAFELYKNLVVLPFLESMNVT